MGAPGFKVDPGYTPSCLDAESSRSHLRKNFIQKTAA
jgi:hypothetical protein